MPVVLGTCDESMVWVKHGCFRVYLHHIGCEPTASSACLAWLGQVQRQWICSRD